MSDIKYINLAVEHL